MHVGRNLDWYQIELFIVNKGKSTKEKEQQSGLGSCTVLFS